MNQNILMQSEETEYYMELYISLVYLNKISVSNILLRFKIVITIDSNFMA